MGRSSKILLIVMLATYAVDKIISMIPESGGAYNVNASDWTEMNNMLGDEALEIEERLRKLHGFFFKNGQFGAVG